MENPTKDINSETVLTKAATSLAAAAAALEKLGHTRERAHKPPTPKRGLTRIEAASYIGISPTTLDRLVAQGKIPKPLKAFSRRIWDLNALDAAFETLATAPDDNPWN
ncbi:hypothetical protein WNY37_18475 [Henriciella sp. AS95]|uniref:helix-turn-helix transcriptional regulator n=1 Tax=Henriciella sp. AS95 TaxID=3135782 RepID=UPI0031804FD7